MANDTRIVLESARILSDRERNVWDFIQEPGAIYGEHLSKQAYARFMYEKFSQTETGKLLAIKEQIRREESDDEEIPLKRQISLGDIAVGVGELNKAVRTIRIVLMIIACVLIYIALR